MQHQSTSKIECWCLEYCGRVRPAFTKRALVQNTPTKFSCNINEDKPHALFSLHCHQGKEDKFHVNLRIQHNSSCLGISQKENPLLFSLPFHSPIFTDPKFLVVFLKAKGSSPEHKHLPTHPVLGRTEDKS